MDNFYCKFNKMIDCMEHKCDKCGWNPEVARERIKEWERERRQEVKGY